MKHSSLSEEKRKKAELIWEEVLSNKENYLTDIEELEGISSIEIFSRQIEIKPGTYIYFNDAAKRGIKEMSSIFLSEHRIGKNSSFDSIYRSIRDEIKNMFLSTSESDIDLSFGDFEIYVIERISSNIKNYSYCFPVNGLTLKENIGVDLGVIRIFEFDLNELNSLLDQDPKVTKENEKDYKKFFEEGFLRNICIKCSCTGDPIFSEKFARFRIEETINYLRYVICLHFHERIYEEIIPRITLNFESFVNETIFLAKEDGSQSLSFHWGPKRANLRGQDFPLSLQKIVQLKEDVYYDLISKLLNSAVRTELEDCTMKAICWIGEAQNDFNHDTSYLKYWTALEGIFPKKDGKTHAIARGVSILLTELGGYQFIKSDDEIFSVYETICMLYEKRGDIIHDGLRNSVSQRELAEICKLTCWVILCLLFLILEGKTEISQVDNAIKERFGKLPQPIIQQCKNARSRKNI